MLRQCEHYDSWSIVRYDCSSSKSSSSIMLKLSPWPEAKVQLISRLLTSGVRSPELGVARYSINLCELSFATALVASAVDHNDNWTKPVQPSTRLSLSPHTIFTPLM